MSLSDYNYPSEKHDIRCLASAIPRPTNRNNHAVKIRIRPTDYTRFQHEFSWKCLRCRYVYYRRWKRFVSYLQLLAFYRRLLCHHLSFVLERQNWHKILQYCILFLSLKQSLSLEIFPETVNTDVHIISISHKYLSELKGIFC